jgi:hypothetical protein
MGSTFSAILALQRQAAQHWLRRLGHDWLLHAQSTI